jgi:allantoinase
MPLDPDYLRYPHRRHGMDHDRYEWRMLEDRPPIEWPDGNILALWINVGLQFFPLNQTKGPVPVPVPDGLNTPYADLKTYSHRDYGNRIGIYRFFDVFDAYDVKPTIALQADLAERYPYLLNRILERGDEIMAYGKNMNALHYGGMDQSAETALVADALETLRSRSLQPVSGWLSPAKSESHNTPDILAANGIEYFCDWVNDDMPYLFRTGARPLVAMPLSTELEDRFLLVNNGHSERTYVEQICDAFDLLHAEAGERGGRILSLSLHPWLTGQAHRIHALDRILDYVCAKSGVWPAYAGQIVSAWRRASAGESAAS